MDTDQAARSTALPIQLTSMTQLAEAKTAQDDWTGTKDAAARRRAQTRLNTRAYQDGGRLINTSSVSRLISRAGKRKALGKTAEALATTSQSLVEPEPSVECWDDERQSICIIPLSQMEQTYNSKKPLLHGKSAGRKLNVVFPLCPDHLITLLQFNALRALAVNRSLISGILVTLLDCDEESVHIIPYPPNPELLPKTLLPTFLQQTIPHGDWIDLFPCPEGRDRLIQASGTFDDDELWADCIGGLYEGFPDDEIKQRGIVAWSPPWEITGWEMSEGFLNKWGWLFRGLPGVLQATNRWRTERGESPLV